VPHVNKWCIATSSFDKLDVRKLLGRTCPSIFTLPITLPIISLRTAVTTEQLPHPTSLPSLSLPSHHSNITTPSASILPELARTPEINRSRRLLSPLTVLAPPDKDTALLHMTQGFTTLSESLFPMAQTSRLQWKSHSSLRIKVLYKPLSKRTSPLRRYTTYTHWARSIHLRSQKVQNQIPTTIPSTVEASAEADLDAGMLGYKSTGIRRQLRLTQFSRNSQATTHPLRAQYIITALWKLPRSKNPLSNHKTSRQALSKAISEAGSKV
jgi:hypothetical protein